MAESEPRVSLASVTPAIALGPLDGRYRSATAPLVDYLSEAALNRDRTHVEVEWLIHLTSNAVLPGTAPLSETQQNQLREIVTGFDGNAVAELGEIEKRTVHDVKAVEYYIADRLPAIGVENLTSLVHFGCTSEDINNLSYALGIKGAVENVWLPAAQDLVQQIAAMAEDTRAVPMLSRTHGQPATPTTLGKELAVTVHRLGRQLRRIRNTEFLGKINGATGTYAAHYAAAPQADWQQVARSFVEGLGLTWNPLTTQIESHDWQAELYADIARFNRILHNFCTDVWSYISIGYFAQVPVEGATGSSTMPHKVNPIRFENAEANLEISNGLLDTLASTLVTSRWQRDLTDSSSQRNIGVAFGHSILAISNVAKGLERLHVAEKVLAQDLDSNWEVLGEAIQMVMRAEAVAGTEGMENPYERLKDLTRGHRVDADRMKEFIAGLGLPADAEARLQALTPARYTGIADTLVDHLK
ncbi:MULTISPECIES: adenylosuccinate lyase [unclassified Arthrobacter]|uniref:adenylosuccinate lyase n=1 Tax=unclassified Arthrobacter TaxID=235627 RepID=UPI001E50B3B1|nr:MULTISPECIES: adenylosuccinate lyase [unclassified Arthrobacter]MCC9144405.1 adenylosuccinate lyase [Arthrobacter sp. zg-Y919]MDK1275631.1 adenylosuccinate lyase [Arthrobacter sp. zg.Y919]WIB03000.1 adenylosuccinate lyase [Arthrobacter sp. zg-Y919]